jgi:Cu2+-exporting ATPase
MAAGRFSKALEELAKLMPSDAHKLMPDGSVKDVPLSELAVDDRVLVKPGVTVIRYILVQPEKSLTKKSLTLKQLRPFRDK